MNPLSQIEVYCDEDADVQLFKRLRNLSTILSKIPNANINTYPQSAAARKISKYNKIFPLFAFDRPDYILTLASVPILVVEVTEHAYTGDNGLQRFVRVASAAENKVPFIYFGPIARVRDDELDLADDVSLLSKRRLTSDFFEGMLALHNFYKVPMIFTEWITAHNGKVEKLPLSSTDLEFSKVYGNLCLLITAIINLASDGSGKEAVSAANLITETQKNLLRLAGKKNTRDSDVKFELNRDRTIQLITAPQRILEYLDDYFFKGKPDKLLALFAIQNSRCDRILFNDGVISDKAEVASLFSKISSLDPFRNGAYIYFSGYKWRSDPHCGVAINIYYRKCFSARLPLILFYPRISIDPSTTQGLLNEIRNTQKLQNLFKERYQSDFVEKYRTTVSSDSLYSTWIGSTKQGRIFLRYCSLIVCNDGIVVGEPFLRLL